MGTVEEGKRADLIVVARDPLQHPEVFADPDNVELVVRNGSVVKDVAINGARSRP